MVDLERRLDEILDRLGRIEKELAQIFRPIELSWIPDKQQIHSELCGHFDRYPTTAGDVCRGCGKVFPPTFREGGAE